MTGCQKGIRIATIAGIPIYLHVSWFVIFGGLASLDEDPRSPGAEFWVAIAGPLARLLVAGGTAFAYLLIGYGIYSLLTGAGLGGLWAMLIGWFMKEASTAAGR